MSFYLLDTNVFSELRKGTRGNPGIQRWRARVCDRTVFLCTPVLAELRYGTELQRRKDSVQAQILDTWSMTIRKEFESRGDFFTFGAAEAVAYGELMAVRPIGVVDCQIAAIASVHDTTVVTRNLKDFDQLDIDLINPFD